MWGPPGDAPLAYQWVAEWEEDKGSDLSELYVEGDGTKR